MPAYHPLFWVASWLVRQSQLVYDLRLQARPRVSSPHNFTQQRCQVSPEGEALVWALQETDQEEHLGLPSWS